METQLYHKSKIEKKIQYVLLRFSYGLQNGLEYEEERVLICFSTQ